MTEASTRASLMRVRLVTPAKELNRKSRESVGVRKRERWRRIRNTVPENSVSAATGELEGDIGVGGIEELSLSPSSLKARPSVF